MVLGEFKSVFYGLEILCKSVQASICHNVRRYQRILRAARHLPSQYFRMSLCILAPWFLFFGSEIFYNSLCYNVRRAILLFSSLTSERITRFSQKLVVTSIYDLEPQRYLTWSDI